MTERTSGHQHSDAPRLNTDELRRWDDWKRATDNVWNSVVSCINTRTGLSGADFSVLTRVIELGDTRIHGNGIQQARLAEVLRWERSRLSRQLTRMSDRGLLRREVIDGIRIIVPTQTGRDVAGKARAAHAAAVRAYLLNRIDDSHSDRFWHTIDILGTQEDRGHRP